MRRTRHSSSRCAFVAVAVTAFALSSCGGAGDADLETRSSGEPSGEAAPSTSGVDPTDKPPADDDAEVSPGFIRSVNGCDAVKDVLDSLYGRELTISDGLETDISADESGADLATTCTPGVHGIRGALAPTTISVGWDLLSHGSDRLVSLAWVVQDPELDRTGWTFASSYEAEGDQAAMLFVLLTESGRFDCSAFRDDSDGGMDALQEQAAAISRACSEMRALLYHP